MCFALELVHFVCDHATPTINEKLWSKVIAICMVFPYTTHEQEIT